MLAVVRAAVPACLVVLLGCSAVGDPAAAEFVRSLQNSDGGFAQKPGDKSGVGPTSAGLRALNMLKAEAKDRKAAEEYIRKCIDYDAGTFAPEPAGKPTVFSTCVGLMGLNALWPVPTYTTLGRVWSVGAKTVPWLAENTKTFDDVRIAAAALEAIDRKSPKQAEWIALVEKMQKPDGTFGAGGGAARATGGAAVALLRMGATLKDPEAVLKTLRAGQQADGGWSADGVAASDGETTYRVMRCFHMMKAAPDAAKLRGFLAGCRNPDGGWGVKPGEPSTMSGTYYALTVLGWLGEP